MKVARTVLNGGDEETCMVQRALSLSNSLAAATARGSPRALGLSQNLTMALQNEAQNLY